MIIKELDIKLGDLVKHENKIYIYVGKKFNTMLKIDVCLIICVNSLIL